MSTPEHEQFAHLDGAYVLGALSPEERYDFEQHLRDCPECQANVGEIAGLPGLLSKVPVEQATSTVAKDPPPNLLPGLLRRAARERTRTRRSAIVSWVAAAAACIALTVVSIPWGGQAAETFPTQLAAVNAGTTTKMSAHIEPVGWGTKIDIQCDDRDTVQVTPYRAVFKLVIVTKSGENIVVGTWKGLPGKMTVVPNSTWVPLEDIKSIEIRTMHGNATVFKSKV